VSDQGQTVTGEDEADASQEFARSIDASEVDALEFAQAIAAASDEQIREGLSGPMRERALSEIFRRMEEHFDTTKASGVDAVIHWRIGGRPGGGHDQYETVIRDGTCTVTEGGGAEPRVSFQLDDPVDFLRLVTGNANGPMLFMTGKLKIAGDMMFAPRVQSFFRIPS
jgi:putative sterol carrier protein